MTKSLQSIVFDAAAAAEKRRVDLVAVKRRRRWLAENESAFADYNDRVDREGVFSNGLRRF